MLDYLKAVVDVPSAEEYLQVNKYGQLARKDKASIVIYMKQICQMHQMLSENAKEITEGDEDHLNVILKELGTAPRCPDDDGSTELPYSCRVPVAHSLVFASRDGAATRLGEPFPSRALQDGPQEEP